MRNPRALWTALVLLPLLAGSALPATHEPAAITARGPTLDRNPASMGQAITATLHDVEAVLPAELGSLLLVGWRNRPTVSCDWGRFSTTGGTTATGAFASAGVHRIAAVVTVRGIADYSSVDGAGELYTEAVEILGRRTFESTVLVQQETALAVLVTAPRCVSVNQRGIVLEARVVRGGEAAAGLPVAFSSDGLTIPPVAAETNADGVATVVAEAGTTPSPHVDGSHVRAVVRDPARGSAMGAARLTVIRLNDPTPEAPRILVGGFSHNELYSVVLTFSVSPAVAGVPLSFAFAPGDRKGFDCLPRLEEASAATDASGRASVRVRSGDVRWSPTILCTAAACNASTTVTFEGITGCRTVEVK